VSKKTNTDKAEEELDKVSCKEVDGDLHTIETHRTPEEKHKADLKDKDNNPAIIQDGMSIKEFDKLKNTPQTEQKHTPEIIAKESLSPTEIPLSPLESNSRGMNYFRKKAKSKQLGKGEMPKGAGQPHGPAMPQPPKMPIPPSNSPAASAAKQAQISGKGGYKPPHTPGAPQIKNPTSKPTAKPKPGYFKNILNKNPAVKKFELKTTADNLYKATCKECGVPEFTPDKDGVPTFTPCACFLVLKKNEESSSFVNILRKNDGTYSLVFNPKADPDTVKLFLLTMKSKLLLKKKFGV
jgi:hypothetical protein